MTEFDLTLHQGRIVTADADYVGDIGIVNGAIAAIASTLPAGRRAIDATGRLVMPGGIDSHCHVEQLSSMGVLCADDWHTASISAAHGGNTTIVPFAAQHRGQADGALRRLVFRDGIMAHRVVLGRGVTGRQQVARDPADHIVVLGVHHRQRAFARGNGEHVQQLAVVQLELVVGHEDLERGDAGADQLGQVTVQRLGRGVRDDQVVAVVDHRLLGGRRGVGVGNLAQRLAAVLEVPVLIVHVSTQGGAQAIHAAQTLGAPVYGETCPHYLLLTAEDIDIPGVEGAKFCCSPPPRDPASQLALWQSLDSGTLALLSSDHAPYRYDESGKLPAGDATTFKQIANGLPGLEVRMPLLFSEGVRSGRLTLQQFVALTSTNHARMYGLYPKKGTLAIGADADIAIWDPEKTVTLRAADLHDAVGYTPYEGRQVTGWPTTVISRGDVIVDAGVLQAARGRGRFIARGLPAPLQKTREISPRAALLRKIFPAVIPS